MPDKPVFTFFTLNDFLSHLTPFRSFFPGEETGAPAGGVARMASAIAQGRRDNPERTVALVMGLDFCGPVFHHLRGQAELESLAQAGFNAAVPGIHEFDLGPDAVLDMVERSPFPLLCANLESDEPRLRDNLKPHVILDTPDGKIGIFGLDIVPPGARLKNAPLLRERCDTVTVAREQVAALKEAGCSAIIAATHIGLKADCNLAREVPGIHAIFGAHSHTVTRDPERVQGPGGWTTLVAQAGTGGNLLGRLDLILDESGRTDLETTKWSLVPMDESIGEDKPLADAVNQWQRQTTMFLNTVVGSLSGPADGRKATLFSGESTLGNLVADALRRETGADVALLSAAQINGNAEHPGGTVIWDDIYRWFPFFQGVFCFEISGRELLDVLRLSGSSLTAPENATGPTEIRRGSLLQVSGLRLRYQSDGTLAEALLDSNSGRHPIDPDATYVAAGTSWYLHGGDGYGLLGQMKNWYAETHDAVAVGDYLAHCGPVLPALEGRIIIEK